MKLDKKNFKLLSESGWSPSTNLRKRADEWLELSSGKITKPDDLAYYQIFDDAYTNNFSRAVSAGIDYAKDSPGTLDVVVGNLLNQSAKIRNEDDVITDFRNFLRSTVYAGAETKDDYDRINKEFTQKINSDIQSKQFNAESYPRVLITKVLQAIQKRSKGAVTVDDYLRAIDDYQNIIRKKLGVASYVERGFTKGEAEKLAKEDEKKSAPSGFVDVRRSIGSDDDEEEDEEVTSTAPRVPSTGRIPDEAERLATTPSQPRVARFKSMLEPGSEDIIYAMGDFWEVVKSVGRSSLYAVEVLQAAAKNLGKEDELAALFTIAASKLDESSVEES